MTARSKGVPGTPWSRPERPRREQPALSRTQIVAEALAILDGDGIEALSMRKLGARLNAGATSMYTHVANKDELLALVVDEVFGKIWIPTVTDTDPADWRTTLAECAASTREVVLRHPWMVSVIGDLGLVYFGPNWMRLSEALLTFLDAAGFTPTEANDAMGALLGYVIGTASVEASWLSALARQGRDEQGWMDEPRARRHRGHPGLPAPAPPLHHRGRLSDRRRPRQRLHQRRPTDPGRHRGHPAGPTRQMTHRHFPLSSWTSA